MALQMDTEFAATLAPLMPTLESWSKASLDHVETRRERLASLKSTGDLPPPGVCRIIHHVQTPDGHTLPIWHLFARNPEQSPGQEAAVLHIHGGGFIALSPGIMVTSLSGYVSQSGVQLFSVDYRLAPGNLAHVGKFVAANVEAEFHLYPGLPHGFEGLAPDHSVAREMKARRVRQLRML